MRKGDSLGDRMKSYEAEYNDYLHQDSWAVVRLDGRAFHTLTRHCEKPFDYFMIDSMVEAAIEVCKEIQGFKLAYVQSDEVNIAFTDTGSEEAEHWFGGRLAKITSLTASIMSVAFTNIIREEGWRNAHFDSRVFEMPWNEVANLFVWRQQDWTRNSVQMLGRSLFSHNDLHKKNNTQVKEMCANEGQDWIHLSDIIKNGTFIDSDFNLWHHKYDYHALNDMMGIG